MKERAVSLLLIFVLALFAVSASIAVPIVCRPFYYAHIGALELPERTGWDEGTIRGAYDGVMDYLLKDAPFGTGALRWSESGRSHFEDVRGLFLLDLYLAAASLAALLALLGVARRVRPHRFRRRGPSFWAGVGLLVFFAAVGILGASNFERAFVVFHSLFFPGKTNWLFDPAADQIILILPEAYFRNCAVLALVLVAAFVAVYLILGRKKAEQAQETPELEAAAR